MLQKFNVFKYERINKNFTQKDTGEYEEEWKKHSNAEMQFA